ncbi:PD-(D/E)XK nuclease family protein [uncultured Winogradskyella sp.]|uniref:PD-(D/E)XK nuclease family protein n=1 Tax=uncultured Winogradskyella sp. TaxID=395353 RepID=UPI003511773B
MESFIKQVLIDVKERGIDLNNTVFILPSKRAGVFLKYELSSLIDTPIFSPAILSIEDFVETLSNLSLLPDSELVFKLYETYLEIADKDDQEPFETFFTWANMLLQDFNEIDRYLIEQNDIFDYLKAIKEINHWSLENNQTPLIKKHLKFWNNLGAIYESFVSNLLQQSKGYQGLLYREACNNLEMYLANYADRMHIFLGFNALNTAEKRIIQELLDNDMARIYWDIDSRFILDNYHDAGLFIRSYKTKWKHFKQNSFNWVSTIYSNPKKIKVTGVPKNVGQAKYIGQLAEQLHQEKQSLQNVAIVLGEENLLLPLLNSLPKSVDSVNITMGLPLKYVPLANFFAAMFELHKHNNTSFYYRDIIDFLMLPSSKMLFKKGKVDNASVLIEHIQKNNLTYLSSKKIKTIIPDCENLITLIFDSWEGDPQMALEKSSQIIFEIKSKLNPRENRLEKEYLYRFYTLFNQLTELHHRYNYINDISGLYGLFKELLLLETLDFQGEPLEGLQIMGMLESRALDFETVIISSVNEGILPAGKTANSFIPYDVKVQNKLPTYKEKDAVYTYHFYRLLQRAKEVYIVYNTEIDALKGGERSRFITQLEVEGLHPIEHCIAQPQIPAIEQDVLSIKKTQGLLEELKKIAKQGFSPSSLSNYIRNPLDFYYEKVLHISDFEEVEESVAANTLGTIIHNTLETFYKPLENCFLTVKILESFKGRIKDTITEEFKNTYRQGDFKTGKNLIIFEIAQHLISNFLDLEIDALKKGNTIKILAIESNISCSVSIKGMEWPIVLKGKIDRVDEYNGDVRVIDYKSGKVEQNKVVVDDWEKLTTDYDKYSKPFQLLCYTYMLHKQDKISLPIEAGIYSFKNLNAGLLKFAEKNSAEKTKRNQSITQDTISNFENELHKLLLEIFNPDVDFTEKETD